MTRKDIALTVGGVLATMVLAWIIYKRQSQTSTTSTATSSTSDEALAGSGTTAIVSMPSLPSYGTSQNVPSYGTSQSSIDSSAHEDMTADTSVFDSIISNFAGAIVNQSTSDLGSQLNEITQTHNATSSNSEGGQTTVQNNNPRVPVTISEGPQPGHTNSTTVTGIPVHAPLEEAVAQ